MIDDEAQRKLRLMGLGDVIEILRVQNTSGEAVMSLPFDQRFEMIVPEGEQHQLQQCHPEVLPDPEEASEWRVRWSYHYAHRMPLPGEGER